MRDATIDIAALVVVAAALLDGERRGRVITFEQLLAKMHEVLGRSQVLDTIEVQTALLGMGHCLSKVRGGWRWNRRSEPGRLG